MKSFIFVEILKPHILWSVLCAVLVRTQLDNMVSQPFWRALHRWWVGV